MKLYILRHEERFESPKFYTQLTSTGLINSELLKTILDKERIDLIFSSPFPRVLQTIKPYCDFKNMSNAVCIDYALYETMFDPCFTSDNYAISLNENDSEFYLTDPIYQSSIPLKQIKCPETIQDVTDRVSTFSTSIIEKYKDTNYNILFASHAATLASLIHLNQLYPLGGLTKIYDKDHTVNLPINYVPQAIGYADGKI